METDKRRWHVDKGIPLSLIAGMLLQVVGVIWYIADMRKDVELLKAKSVEQATTNEANDRRVQDTFNRLQSTMDRMSDKLDRLIERGSK